MFPCYGHHGNSYSDQGAFNLMTLGDEDKQYTIKFPLIKKYLLFEEGTLLYSHGAMMICLPLSTAVSFTGPTYGQLSSISLIPI